MSKANMEVTLAATEASNVLNFVSDLISDAVELNPSLESHCGEISKSQKVVELIRSQKSLRTLGVVSGIRKMQTYGDFLKQDLMVLEEKKDYDGLCKNIEYLRNERKELIQQIRIASIGLTMTGNGVYTVDARVVESTNKAIKKVLGKELGLDLPLFLARLKRAPDGNGKFTLSEKEYEEWTWHQTRICNPEIKTLTPEVKTRIIANCLARDQSLQILGPMGEDLWADKGFVKMENLVAEGYAIQIAGAQTMDVFGMVLDASIKRIAATHVKRIEE